MASRRRSFEDTGSTTDAGRGPASVTPRRRSTHRTSAVLQCPSRTSSVDPLSRNQNGAQVGSSRRKRSAGTYEPSRCCAQEFSSAKSLPWRALSEAISASVTSAAVTTMKSTSLCSSASPNAKDPTRYAPTRPWPSARRRPSTNSASTSLRPGNGVGRTRRVYDRPVNRIEWVIANCRLLAAIGDEVGETRPFDGLRIGTGIHLEPKTVALLLTLLRGGAEVVATGNLNTTQQDAIDYLAERGVTVVGRPTSDPAEHDAFLWEVVRSRPDLLLDNGGDLFVRWLEESYDTLRGGTEETTSGRARLEPLRDHIGLPVL